MPLASTSVVITNILTVTQTNVQLLLIKFLIS